MEDYKKFLRYVIPGLVFMIEVFVYVLLSSFDRVKDLIKTYWSDAGISVPISGLLIAAAIGYLFGVVYHCLFHLIRYLELSKLIADHLSLIRDSINRKWLELKNRRDNQIQNDELTQSMAWHIATVFLNTRMESSENIKAAKPRLESFGDLMHGAGTTFIGSVFAIIVWLILHCKLSNNLPFLCILVLAILISILHILNYRNIAKDYQSVSNTIIANELQEESFGGKQPVTMYIE